MCNHRIHWGKKKTYLFPQKSQDFIWSRFHVINGQTVNWIPYLSSCSNILAWYLKLSVFIKDVVVIWLAFLFHWEIPCIIFINVLHGLHKRSYSSLMTNQLRFWPTPVPWIIEIWSNCFIICLIRFLKSQVVYEIKGSVLNLVSETFYDLKNLGIFNIGFWKLLEILMYLIETFIDF